MNQNNSVCGGDGAVESWYKALGQLRKLCVVLKRDSRIKRAPGVNNILYGEWTGKGVMKQNITVFSGNGTMGSWSKASHTNYYVLCDSKIVESEEEKRKTNFLRNGVGEGVMKQNNKARGGNGTVGGWSKALRSRASL